MIRKLHKYDIIFEKKDPKESVQSFYNRLYQKYKCDIKAYSKPQKLYGNQGIIELFPDRPKDLIIKVEGAYDTLEEMYHLFTKKVFYDH